MLPLKYYSVLCFSVMSDSMIMDAIASFLVLPNRLVVPLVPGLPVAQLRSPLPRVRPEYSSAHSDYNCTSSFKTLVPYMNLFSSLRVLYASTYWRHRN